MPFRCVVQGFALYGLCSFCAWTQVIETPHSVINHPDANRVVKLEFGLRAAEPRQWSGEATSSAGSILGAWGWHFNRPDRVIRNSAWEFGVRSISPPGSRYALRYDLPSGLANLPNGVYLSLAAPRSADLTIRTNHGEFRMNLGALEDRGRIAFMDGDVAAVHAPPVRSLTRGEATQHDYPAAVSTDDGLFVAWTAYHDEANRVFLAHHDDERWMTHKATDEMGDYFGTAIASDQSGVIHVLWSEYRDGRWLVVDRAFDPRSGSWGDPTKVDPSGDRQYFPVAKRAADGSVWATWQDFRDDNLDIMAARYADGRWSDPKRVSPSTANDWAPDMAVAKDGSVWVAWDSYETGTYGIYVRRLQADGMGPVILPPTGRSRAIEPSVAVDQAGRVWLAWAESGANWGKDWGVLGRPGKQLREDSNIRLARYANGKWMEPVEPLRNSVPLWMSELHEYPMLEIGSNGAVTVFFRRMILRLPVDEHELVVQIGEDTRRLQPWYDTIRGMSAIRYATFDGAGWHAMQELPLSDGGAYAQLSTAPRADGSIAAVWPTDGRTYLDPHARTSQIRYADLTLDTRYAEAEQMRELAAPDAEFTDAAPTEAVDLANVRAARWSADEPLRLYRGDLHRHTDISADSQRDGDILLGYRYALDVASLDFLAITDHSGAERLHYYRYQWWKNRQIATMFNRPGRFATFFGYERTVTYPGGHRNVISKRREMQPVSISDEEFTGTESWAERLYPALLRNGDIAIAHTTAGGGGTDWRDNDPRAEPVVEVFQALRGSYEEENSPGKARTSATDGLVWAAWKRGWRIGLLANSDHESTHQSYACVWAPELTNGAILDAIKARLSYAATDNIVLRFESGRNDGTSVKMGDEWAPGSAASFRLQVLAPAPISTMEIIRSGEVVYSAAPHLKSIDISYEDQESPGTGSQYYHARLVQADGQIAWSSPIWVD